MKVNRVNNWNFTEFGPDVFFRQQLENHRFFKRLVFVCISTFCYKIYCQTVCENHFVCLKTEKIGFLGGTKLAPYTFTGFTVKVYD